MVLAIEFERWKAKASDGARLGSLVGVEGYRMFRLWRDFKV